VVHKKVGIVGKGLLFDTGGYNIKTGMMELMKFDCGGAAAVLGAARAVGALAPSGVEAHFIVAACENMINEKAMVASDILTASNGKTIEVMNTGKCLCLCSRSPMKHQQHPATRTHTFFSRPCLYCMYRCRRPTHIGRCASICR
jgi:hypothetical protein